MKKSLALAIAMALGVTASAYAANPFADVPAGHWAYTSINKLAASGILDGYGDGSFGGDRLMTRYEMAQIIAKAMAKGTNVDRLAAEFSDELNTLGMRITVLEKKSDNIKITGEIRAHYQSYRKPELATPAYNYTRYCRDSGELRSRIWITGQINKDWNYTGMLENIQNLSNNAGDEKTDFQRAFVTGKIGGVNIEAGRNNTILGGGEGNIFNNRTDSVKINFGKDIKIGAQAGKLSSIPTISEISSVGGHYWSVNVDGKIGKLTLGTAYHKFTDLFSGHWDLDAKIWDVTATYDFGNLAADLTYLHAQNSNPSNDTYSNKGFVAGLSYKGAKATHPNSWGVYANYYDQGDGTYIDHGMNISLADYMMTSSGFEGYKVGANYAVAKNMIATVEYADFKSKTDNLKNSAVWSEMTFIF